MQKKEYKKENKLKKTTAPKRLCGFLLAALTVVSVSCANVCAEATLTDAQQELPLYYDSLTTDEKNIYVHLR